MKEINAYLRFDGNCAEAMKFYEKCLKADLQMMPFSEIPGGQIPPGTENRVMHARLTKGGATLMGSDVMPGHGVFQKGTNFSVSVNCANKKEVDDYSNALKEGGKLTMPAQDMFWGAYFAMVSDKFGVDWMFNYDLPKSQG